MGFDSLFSCTLLHKPFQFSLKIASFYWQLIYEIKYLCLQDLHDKLDNCVQEHNNFNTKCKNCRDWINAEKEKLHECDDISGEKSDISRRLSQAKVFIRTVRLLL